jgi:hypothetical protein
MGTIWVREFSGGLDARRLPVNTPGGNLIVGFDGHINRGGDFEQRADFVAEYTLPAGTFGLSADDNNLAVFGSAAAPTLPVGIIYQRLQHPDGTTAMRDVLSVDRFANKFYVIAEFADGRFFHYYDGTLVADWADGKAKASFTVTAGSSTPGAQAVGSIRVAQTQFSSREVTSVTVNGVNLMGGVAVVIGLGNVDTAIVIVNRINERTGIHGYTASRQTNGANNSLPSDCTIIIRTVAQSPAANGFVVDGTSFNGSVQFADKVNMAGGAVPVESRLTGLTIDSVSVIAGAIGWVANPSTSAMAAAIANSINSTSTAYTAVAVGSRVDVTAVADGPGPNGDAFVFTVANGLVITPASGLEMAGGGVISSGYAPGRYARTAKEKMYSLSGSVLHFSAVADPTSWLTSDPGAGFVDVAGINSGFASLIALSRYQQFLAVFAEDATMIYFIDPDPDLNREVQILNNTGTLSPLSVTQFGDGDIFYLHESGLRSLRARDSSQAAMSIDIGSPIDDILQPIVASMPLADRAKIIGLIEPRDGRFWLIVNQQIFVFTFYPGSKISAWSIYRIGFNVDDAVKHKRRVYLRSGNTIYVYGGLGATPRYGEAEAVAQLPFLDGGRPNVKKGFRSYDVACTGTWKVELGMNPNDQTVLDTLGRVFETTYNGPILSGAGESTHFSLKFTLERAPASGPAKLSSVTIHHDGDDVSDG